MFTRVWVLNICMFKYQIGNQHNLHAEIDNIQGVMGIDKDSHCEGIVDTARGDENFSRGFQG